MLSIMNEIDPCLLLSLCVLYEIQNQIYHQKAPVLNEETKKGQRVVTPQVDQNNKTRAVHPSLIQLHPTLLQRYRWWKNEWTLWWTLLEGEYPATLTIWSIEPIHHHHIHQLLPPTAKVSHATDKKLRRSQEPFRSLGILQFPDAPSRSGGQDHV